MIKLGIILTKYPSVLKGLFTQLANGTKWASVKGIQGQENMPKLENLGKHDLSRNHFHLVAIWRSFHLTGKQESCEGGENVKTLKCSQVVINSDVKQASDCNGDKIFRIIKDLQKKTRQGPRLSC